MGTFAVVFLRRAADQVAQGRNWWLEHRPAAPGLFDRELAAAVDRIAAFPGSGTSILHPAGQVRRTLLPECRYFVYYRVRPRAQRCEVIAVLHASRLT